MTSSLSCGEDYGTGTNAVKTPAPSPETSWILDRVAEFCTPRHAKDDIILVERGQPYYNTYKVPKTDGMLLQLDVEYSPDPACAGPDVPTPTVRVASMPSGKRGPDYYCQRYLSEVTNACDTAPGQGKSGGCLHVDCAIWCWASIKRK